MEPTQTSALTPYQQMNRLFTELFPQVHEDGLILERVHTDPQPGEAWAFVRVDAGMIELIEQWMAYEGAGRNSTFVSGFINDAIQREGIRLERKQKREGKQKEQAQQTERYERTVAEERQAEADYNAKFLADLGISMDGEA
jgi:hypothetical protein